MKIESFLMGLIIFSIFMVGGSMIFYDMVQSYEVETNMSLFNGSQNESSDSYWDVLDEMDTTTEQMKNRTIGTDTTAGQVEGGWDILMVGVIGTVKLVGNSFELVTVITNQIAFAVGMPSWIVNGVLMLFTLGVIFAVIRMITRFKE